MKAIILFLFFVLFASVSQAECICYGWCLVKSNENICGAIQGVSVRAKRPIQTDDVSLIEAWNKLKVQDCQGLMVSNFYSYPRSPMCVISYSLTTPAMSCKCSNE